jgi:hypothetical protein
MMDAPRSEGTRLHIDGLAPELTAKELATRFEPFGEVSDPIIVRERVDASGAAYDEASPSRGFGYVTLRPRDDEQLALCLRTYNGVRWRGRVLRVNYANELYLDRIARERAEAQAGGDAYSSDDEEREGDDKPAEWVFAPELRIRGQHKSQLAVIDPAASRPPNRHVVLPDDAVDVRPSKINWEPIRGKGARTPGMSRWALGGIADSVEPLPELRSRASARVRALEREIPSGAAQSVRMRRVRRQPRLRAIAMYGIGGVRLRRRVSRAMRILGARFGKRE